MVCRESFYIRVNHNLYYVLNNEPIVRHPHSPEFEQTMAPASLEYISQKALLSLDQSKTVNGRDLHNILITSMLEDSVRYKVENVRIKEIIKIIDEKLALYDAEIQEANFDSDRKAKKRVGLFTAFILFQYAVVHYLVYFHLSWDIMEPVTCILTNIDILLSYCFFLFSGRNYTLE